MCGLCADLLRRRCSVYHATLVGVRHQLGEGVPDEGSLDRGRNLLRLSACAARGGLTMGYLIAWALVAVFWLALGWLALRLWSRSLVDPELRYPMCGGVLAAPYAETELEADWRWSRHYGGSGPLGVYRLTSGPPGQRWVSCGCSVGPMGSETAAGG